MQQFPRMFASHHHPHQHGWPTGAPAGMNGGGFNYVMTGRGEDYDGMAGVGAQTLGFPTAAGAVPAIPVRYILSPPYHSHALAFILPYYLALAHHDTLLT